MKKALIITLMAFCLLAQAEDLTPSIQAQQYLNPSNLASKEDISAISNYFIELNNNLINMKSMILIQQMTLPLIVMGIGIVLNLILIYFVLNRKLNKLNKKLDSIDAMSKRIEDANATVSLLHTNLSNLETEIKNQNVKTKKVK